MWVQKLKSLEITCPNCGAKISISNDEYLKYRKETEDYGNTITCQRYLTQEDKFKYDGKHFDIEYTNMDCPLCKHYIPITVSSDGRDSDVWGFVYSENVEPKYDILPTELPLEEYLRDNFFGGETSENESN